MHTITYDEEYLEQLNHQAQEEAMFLKSYAEVIHAITHQRKCLHLTQQALADKCHLSRTTISKIETMSVVPKLDILIRILHHLKLDITIATYEKHR